MGCIDPIQIKYKGFLLRNSQYCLYHQYCGSQKCYSSRATMHLAINTNKAIICPSW